MIELKFHRKVYSGKAVDAAVKRFESFARFELEEVDHAFVVRLEAQSPARERRIAGELGNFALGMTVDRGGADA